MLWSRYVRDNTPSPSSPPNPIFLSTQYQLVTNLVALTGGWDRITEKIPSDIEKQIEQAFDNVEAALKTAGSKGWEDVFSLTSHHMPMSDKAMEIMVRLLKKHCPNHQPIWTSLGVPALAFPDMKVEIEVRAYSPKK